MPKTLRKPGKNTSAEVQGISGRGLWLLVDGREHYLPFSQYPWFQGGTVRQVFRLLRPAKNHLYWPDLDVDLELDSLSHPEAYPLVFHRDDKLKGLLALRGKLKLRSSWKKLREMELREV